MIVGDTVLPFEDGRCHFEDRLRKGTRRWRSMVFSLVLNVTLRTVAKSVERLTAERVVADSIPGAGSILWVLSTAFALKTAAPLRGLDHYR